MTWLAFLFALEIGIVPQEIHVQYWPGVIEFQKSTALYGTLEAELIFFNYIFLGSAVETTMAMESGGTSYRPSGIAFDFEIGILFGPVKFAYRHMCQHPLLTDCDWTEETWRQGSSDRVYIRFEGGDR